MRRTARLAVGITLAVWGSGLAACSPMAIPATSDPTSRRFTHSGEVVGKAGLYANHEWIGIPYAKPPVGSLRWRAPRTPEPWTGLRQAIAPASPCAQFASAFGGTKGREGEIVGSEDCLYLNIAAPRFSPDQVPQGDKRLPVMVWIHGGGNTLGHGTAYNGGHLAVKEDVVVVTFNYRLGPLGWFRHAALRGAGTSSDDRSGNYGTLDIVRALEWVRDNIASFGGDPDNVTIFGESAGGTNVYTMLLSPRAKGLFHRAIVESGSTSADTPAAAENFVDAEEPGHRASSNEILLKLLAVDAGGAADRAAGKTRLATMTPGQIETYLRGKSAAAILSPYAAGGAAGLLDMPKVFRDGAVLPQEPLVDRLAVAGGYNQVPVMLGSNRDENKLFMYVDPKLVRKFLWLVPKARDPRWYDLTAEYLAKMWKASGVDVPASSMHSVQGDSVFAYRFDWDEEPSVFGADLGNLLGAAHAFEIPFVFGHFDMGEQVNVIFTEENAAGREALSAQMMSYWAEFAYTGKPGRGRRGELPEWSAWSAAPGAARYLVFDTPTGGGLQTGTETWSKAAVLAAIDGDERFVDQRERCAMFAELALRSRALTPAEYESAGAKGCREFPLPPKP